ncbi:MAG: LemA family protein, partial [Candidatus Liptonbacteria bacterium]|nr:LemA family protein [Candidatus Liptonbacteria bacterium]
LLVAGAIVLWVVLTYNRLVTLKNRVKEARSDIEVQEKRRYDLVPNLVESVKGYLTHEKGVLKSVTDARTRAMHAHEGKEKTVAENALASTLKTLFAVAENYPDLKANANFLDLQRELSDTENKIQAARRFSNATINDLNTKIESFPTNLVAGIFGFRQGEFFDAEAESEKPIRVRF